MTTFLLPSTSLALLTLSLLLFRRQRHALLPRLLYTGLALVSISMTTLHLVADSFTGEGVDEATLFHLEYGLSGAGFSEYLPLIIGGGMALVVFTALFIGASFSRRARAIEDRKILAIPYVLVLLSIGINPSVHSLVQHYGSVATTSPFDFHDYYKAAHAKPTRNKTKNLVFIYAESLERTYFNEDVFPGLIQELRDLEKKSTYFTKISQVYGTGWTVGGISANLLGIPLFTTSHGNSMSGMDQFLPSAVGLGELLRENGYRLSFMGGASLDFAGKGKLFRSHGFTEVLGRDELLPQIPDPTYCTGWGLFDDSLLEFVYERFVQLSDLGESFALFTLTLDTHQPAGAPSRSVAHVTYRDGGNPILNAVAGSDVLLSKFIRRICDSPYATNTLIVLASDHLAMKNTAYTSLTSKDRTNLFMIIDPSRMENGKQRIDTSGSALDIGPTLLPFLGLEGEYGLGRDLMDDSPETRLEREIIRKNVRLWRDSLMAFWDFPVLKDFLDIDADNNEASIGNRTFQTPMLIELDNDLNTRLWFQHHGDQSNKTLWEYWQAASPTAHQLLICSGEEIRPILDSRGMKNNADATYLVAGSEGRVRSVREVFGHATFSASELRESLGLSESSQFDSLRVAHAGGAVGSYTYTNSFEALDRNINNGFKYFEMDFVFTSDRELVCLHDWGESFKRSFGHDTDHRLSLAEFETAVETESQFHKCTLRGLATWMREHPDATIVTDVKEDNLDALAIIAATLPDSATRVIPQIYQPESFNKVRALGFEQIIWTLYRYAGNNADVLSWVGRFSGRFAVTMPKYKAASTLPRDLSARGVSTYVHTVNSENEAFLFQAGLGVTELYTDHLVPGSQPSVFPWRFGARRPR